MTEEEAKSVNNQEAATPVAESEDTSQEATQSAIDTSTPAEGTKEYNWSQMRKKNEELENRVNEMLRREEERNAPPPPKEDEELNTLADDDIITVAQARKLSEKQAEALIKKALEQRERASLPERTRGKFQDFDSIMTEDNIKKLEKEEPGLAEACSKASNPWEATYKILKKFVLPSEDVNKNKGNQKMEENLSKPASSNSVGRQSPLSDANTWAEASKDELYKEMMQAARSAQ